MILGKNINLMRSNRKLVLKDISFTCSPGRVTAFIGKSGAGKTSALRCLAGLEANFVGSLTCDQQDARKLGPQVRAKTIGYVAQNYNLFPNLTALENCTLALKAVLGKKTDQADQLARQTLEKVGMGAYSASYPSQLSGGQKQRVAIARALCLDPKVLLLDEPTSALDPQNVDSLSALLKQLAAQKMTVVLSSQDMRMVNMVYDDIFLFADGEIIEHGARDQIAQRHQSAIKNLIGF